MFSLSNLRKVYTGFSRSFLWKPLYPGLRWESNKSGGPASTNDEDLDCKSKEKTVICSVIHGLDGSDAKKLPRPVRLENPAPVRHGFIPEDWFRMFYPKTGVTGPYMFGFGVFTFLASKEIYVMEHEFYNGLSLAIMAIATVKGLGPMIAAYADKEIENYEKHWYQSFLDEVRNLENAIAREKLEQWRAEGAIHLVDLKRRNIELQLEAAYRQALYDFYKEVIHCLEYQVECHHVEQRVQKKHMIQWVAKEVMAGLPPMTKEEEKKAKGDMSAMCLQLR